MRWLRGTIGALLILTFMPSSVSAVTSEPSTGYTAPTNSALLITEFMATNDRLDYVQMFNDSDTLFSLDGWTAEYELVDGTVVDLQLELSGLMKPKSYAVLADTTTKLSTPFLYTISSTDAGSVKTVRLHPPANAKYISEVVDTPGYTKANQCSGELPLVTQYPAHYLLTREISTTTGDYLSGMCYVDDTDDRTIFLDELYTLPAPPQLQIVEILPNAKKCSPFEERLDCQNYVKLFNPTTKSISLDAYRMRSGYQGQSATNSNTYYFSGSLAPGEHRTYKAGISSTNSWIWFEDVYGQEQYSSTVVSYPTAGVSREGQAWMYDESDGTWKWTSELSGVNNAPIYKEVVVSSSTSSSLTACRSDQFRNPLTNRCKLKSATASGLVACASNQIRNPATNRCKLVATTASSLTPCKAGQFRNPATNRCKSSTLASSSLKPCTANQERNPDTNRCRNKTNAIPDAAFAVKSVKEGGKAFAGWWALGGVGVLAVGYGAWEWRREVIGFIQKIGIFFSSGR